MNYIIKWLIKPFCVSCLYEVVVDAWNKRSLGTKAICFTYVRLRVSDKLKVDVSVY